MTQDEEGSYGIQWPRWYVYRRGLKWLRSGFCPNCFSSPPNDACRICEGCYQYGPGRLSTGNAADWHHRWKIWYQSKKWDRLDEKNRKKLERHNVRLK